MNEFTNAPNIKERFPVLLILGFFAVTPSIWLNIVAEKIMTSNPESFPFSVGAMAAILIAVTVTLASVFFILSLVKDWISCRSVKKVFITENEIILLKDNEKQIIISQPNDIHSLEIDSNEVVFRVKKELGSIPISSSDLSEIRDSKKKQNPTKSLERVFSSINQ